MLRVVQVGYGYWGANIARKLTASSRFDFKALCEILPDHFVYGNEPELDGYRKELGL